MIAASIRIKSVQIVFARVNNKTISDVILHSRQEPSICMCITNAGFPTFKGCCLTCNGTNRNTRDSRKKFTSLCPSKLTIHLESTDKFEKILTKVMFLVFELQLLDLMPLNKQET